jgi:hypothetical protein
MHYKRCFSVDQHNFSTSKLCGLLLDDRHSLSDSLSWFGSVWSPRGLGLGSGVCLGSGLKSMYRPSTTPGPEVG